MNKELEEIKEEIEKENKITDIERIAYPKHLIEALEETEKEVKTLEKDFKEFKEEEKTDGHYESIFEGVALIGSLIAFAGEISNKDYLKILSLPLIVGGSMGLVYLKDKDNWNNYLKENLPIPINKHLS